MNGNAYGGGDVVEKMYAAQRMQGGGSMAIGAARDPVPGPAVPLALNQLADATAELHDALGSLANRLAPVLGADTANRATGETGRPMGPGVADQILNQVMAVRVASSHVKELLRRLEI